MLRYEQLQKLQPNSPFNWDPYAAISPPLRRSQCGWRSGGKAHYRPIEVQNGAASQGRQEERGQSLLSTVSLVIGSSRISMSTTTSGATIFYTVSSSNSSAATLRHTTAPNVSGVRTGRQIQQHSADDEQKETVNAKHHALAFTTTRIPSVCTTVIGVSGAMNSPCVMTSTM